MGFLKSRSAYSTISLFFDQGNVVVPGNLCKDLLHNLALRPGRCKGTHVFEVARGEASHVWKRLPSGVKTKSPFPFRE